jgi:hypothetical protein
VRLRNQVDPQELREGCGIDRIGLHLRVADRLEIPGVTEPEINTLGHQQIPEPLIASRQASTEGTVRLSEAA